MVGEAECSSKSALVAAEPANPEPSESQFTIDYTKVLWCHQWKWKFLLSIHNETQKMKKMYKMRSSVTMEKA